MKHTQSTKKMSRLEAEWNALSEDQKEGFVILFLIFLACILIMLAAWFVLGLGISGGFGYVVAFLTISISFGANVFHWLAKR